MQWWKEKISAAISSFYIEHFVPLNSDPMLPNSLKYFQRVFDSVSVHKCGR